MNSFSKDHFSMMLQYVGISFLTGAVSHGFFSGTRSLILAGIGIICFLLGMLLATKEESSLGKTLFFSIFLALSIGMFTGGLQHFLDSPDRSLFITPLGFLGSLLFFALIHSYTLSKPSYWYIASSTVLVVLFSYGYFVLLSSMGITGINTHHMMDSSSVSMPSSAMSSMCHQMPNGEWMGDCSSNPLASPVSPQMHHNH